MAKFIFVFSKAFLGPQACALAESVTKSRMSHTFKAYNSCGYVFSLTLFFGMRPTKHKNVWTTAKIVNA